VIVDDVLKVRASAFSYVTLYIAPYLGLSLFITIDSLSATGGYQWFGLVVGGLMLAMCAFLIAMLIARAQGIEVSADRVRLRRVFAWTDFEISDIAGVGVLYQRIVAAGNRAPAGWQLMLWTKDGQRYAAAQFAISTWGLPDDLTDAQRSAIRSKEQPWPADAPVPNEAKVAGSRAGKAAKQVYDRVLAAQGPYGALATQELQKHQVFRLTDRPRLVAYWSPDGDAGRTTVPESHP
jgi:hypothetical protein